MPPEHDRSDSTSDSASPPGPPLKRQKYNVTEAPVTQSTLAPKEASHPLTDHSSVGSSLSSSENFREDTISNPSEDTSGGETDSDDGSLFDFGAGQSLAPSVLCARCQYICDNWFSVLSRRLSDRIEFPHCENSFVLEASAKQGCSLCAQFMASVDPEWLEASRQRWNKKSGVRTGSNGGRVNVQNTAYPAAVNLIHGRHCWTLHLSFGRGSGNFFVDMVPVLGPGKSIQRRRLFSAIADLCDSMSYTA